MNFQWKLCNNAEWVTQYFNILYTNKKYENTISTIFYNTDETKQFHRRYHS